MKKWSMFFLLLFFSIEGMYTIQSVPYVIREPGLYLLSQDIKFPADRAEELGATAIYITTSKVILDLNGNIVDMSDGHFAIAVKADKEGVVIKNGTIKNALFSVVSPGSRLSVHNIIIHKVRPQSIEYEMLLQKGNHPIDKDVMMINTDHCKK